MMRSLNVGSLADWVSAIGTVSACVIALLLARRQSRPQPAVYSTLWGYSNTEDGPSVMRGVDVSVTNVGYQPFAVQLCILTIGFFRPAAFEFRGADDGGPRLLEHGDRVTVTYSLSEVHQSVQDALRARRFGWLERRFARTYRALVYLSSGEMHYAVLDGASRRYLSSKELPPDVGPLPKSSNRPRYFRVKEPRSSTGPSTSSRSRIVAEKK